METNKDNANAHVVSGLRKVDTNLETAVRMTGEIAASLVRLTCMGHGRVSHLHQRVSVIPSYEHLLQASK